MIYEQLKREAEIIYDFGHRPRGEPLPTNPTDPAVPTNAALATTDATESVRAELNAMFDAFQAVTHSLSGMDEAGQTRVRSWLKDHLDL